MSQVPAAPAPVHRRLPSRRVMLSAVVAAVLVLTAGFVVWLVSRPGGLAAAGDEGPQSFVGVADPGPLRLVVTPADGAKGVKLNQTVKVQAEAGTLESVKVTRDGETLPGTFDPRGTTWTSTDGLAPGRYKVSVVATGHDGQRVTETSTFTTMRPEKELKTAIMPLDGETVGVGMPIAIWFNEPVRNRAEVERRLEVDSSSNVEGAWHWFNDEEVRWRPKTYWPAGEKVTLRVRLTGVHAGDGVWGVKDRVIKFQVGDAHISKVNVHTHRMVVTRNGKTVRTMPVSTGSEKYPSTNGVHIVLGKEASRVMDSSTVPGIPASEAYRVNVKWATRISNSGEFVHAAPWSVGAQGRANVSHGCVNLSTENAAWFYRFSQRGDIVEIIGSSKKARDVEGLKEWNRSWEEWLAGSALR